MLNALIAKHLREAYFGRNWPATNVEEHLADVTWEQAVQPIAGKNTIATLIDELPESNWDKDFTDPNQVHFENDDLKQETRTLVNL